MKRRYIALVILMIDWPTGGSVEQESVIMPKAKRVYVSEQQCVELEGEIIICGTDASGALADLLKTIFLVVKSALDKVNAHIEGEKSSSTKVERTDRYEKRVKIKLELERCIKKIRKMVHRFEELLSE